ncbi:hypothetical protein BJX62DRAFT_5960 [Aspergillus germanicus]
MFSAVYPQNDFPLLTYLHSRHCIRSVNYYSKFISLFTFSNICTRCMFYVPGSLPVGVSCYTGKWLATTELMLYYYSLLIFAGIGIDASHARSIGGSKT